VTVEASPTPTEEPSEDADSSATFAFGTPFSDYTLDRLSQRAAEVAQRAAGSDNPT